MQIQVAHALCKQGCRLISYTANIRLVTIATCYNCPRSPLLTDLQEVLEPDEMHMMAVLIGGVVLTVKVEKELGEQFKTEVGIAQGDCQSAVLFIFS